MTDALVELEALLPQVGPAVERRRFGESLGRTLDALREAPRQTERLAALIEVARETGAQADAIAHLQEAVDEAADSMLSAADANGLREVQDTYKALLQELGRAETLLRRHWNSVVDRDFRPLTVIGRLLADIEATAEVGRRFMACGEAAERSTAASGLAQALRDTIVRLKHQRIGLQAERQILTQNAEVDVFLDALATGRATLRHVTPGVREWLDRNGALDGFSVRSQS